MAKYTGLQSVMGGCDQCHGEGVAGWFARNAMGVAAKHHQATGHTTWVDQVISVRWGERADDAEPAQRVSVPGGRLA